MYSMVVIYSMWEGSGVCDGGGVGVCGGVWEGGGVCGKAWEPPDNILIPLYSDVCDIGDISPGCLIPNLITFQ